MAEKPKTLAEAGFKLGDLVLYASVRDSTGGIIFQIVEDTEPIKPACTRRQAKVRERHYDSAAKDYVWREVEKVQYGAWDENGKKIMEAATHGFVRIKPIFDFFATSKGKNPVGKGKTIIIHYEHIRGSLHPVDLVLLGTKYVELGNIMRDIARRGAEG